MQSPPDQTIDGAGFSLDGAAPTPLAPLTPLTPAAPTTPIPPVAPIGDHAATGFYYAILNFGVIKVVTILGQYTLSWILGGTDFGYIGLATAVVGFGGLFAYAGVREVLIRRWREFDTWSTPAFWMTATLGTGATAVTMAAAPLAAWFFHDARLTPLILILSLQLLFNSLGIIPDARLAADLRFKRQAWINFVTAALVTVLSVIFALLGFHAYSYILPWPIASLVRTLLWWQAARVKVGRDPQVRQWKHMTSDNALMLGGSLFLFVTSQFDYIILGRMYADKSVVGVYYWAFTLSMQAMQLLSANLAGVLLPSLAKLQDERERQRKAFVRAAKVLMVLAVPACLLQATLADPMIRLLFHPRWQPAIPIVAILSIGWAFLTLQFPTLNCFAAQGRFAARMGYLACCAAGFLAAVYLGARQGAAVGAAIGVAAYSALAGPLGVYVAIRPLGGTARDTAGVFAPSLAAGAVSFGLAELVQRTLPTHPLGLMLRAVVIVSVACPAYFLLMRLIAPAATAEVLERSRALLKRDKPSEATRPDAS